MICIIFPIYKKNEFVIKWNFFWKTHPTFDLIPNLASAPVVEIKFSTAGGLLYSREVSRSSFDCRIWWWLQKTIINDSIILVKSVEIILSAHWARTFCNFIVVGKSLFFGRDFYLKSYLLPEYHPQFGPTSVYIRFFCFICGIYHFFDSLNKDR